MTEPTTPTTRSDLLADQAAIAALIAAYGDAVSRRDAAAWGATWAADASWSLMGHAVTGRDAIVALWLGAMAQFDAVSFITALGPVTIAGDRATARCQTHEVLRTTDGAVRRVAGVYDDSYVREPGGWRFARRDFVVVIEH
jgi:uncharacterized protein (TIGR02246 family)